MIHSIQFVSSCDSTGTCTGSETSTGFTSSPSSILSNSGFLMIGYKWSYQMLAWKQKDTYEFSRQNVDLGASQCCLSELSSAKSTWKQSRCSVLSMTSQSLAPFEQMQDLEKLIDPNESKMGSNRRSNERNWRKCRKSKFSNTFMASAYCISSFLSLPLSLLVPLAHPV